MNIKKLHIKLRNQISNPNRTLKFFNEYDQYIMYAVTKSILKIKFILSVLTGTNYPKSIGMKSIGISL